MATTKPKRLKDYEIIHLYLDTQRQKYFDILYDRYINKIYSKCLSLLKDDAWAQDAAQEIFLKIFLNLAKFNQKSKFSTWVYSITYNFCIDLLRRKKKDKKLFVDETGNEAEVLEDVDDKELLEMEISRLKHILDEIPIGDKMVLLMKYQDDMTIKEISEILDKSESAVKMKIKRAKQKAKTAYLKTFTR